MPVKTTTSEIILHEQQKKVAPELVKALMDSVLEQTELTEDQQAKLGEYLGGPEKREEWLQKRDELATVIKAWEKEAEFISEEAKALAQRASQWLQLADRVREFISLQLDSWGVKRVDGRVHMFLLKEASVRVELDSDWETRLPGEFISYKAQPDKESIRVALQEGKEVPSAKLVSGKRALQIR